MTNFVAIDLETATEVKSSICQIGITEVIDGVVQPSKSWFVQPENNEYDAFNIYIHGITPEDTKDSPSFKEVWKEVYPYLEGKTVVAHNTAFDMYALRDAFDDNGMEYPTFEYYCTLRIARYIIKDCGRHTLDVVLNHLGISLENHHRADSDSRGCAELLLKCLEMDGSTLEELETKYHFRRGCFTPGEHRPQLSTLYAKSKKLLITSLEEHPELVDEANYFYGKTVCFTGKFMKLGTRFEQLQKIKDVGGIPVDAVTKKTQVLVVGQQDVKVVGETGKSSKQKKAEKYAKEGVDIEILTEAEFLELC